MPVHEAAVLEPPPAEHRGQVSRWRQRALLIGVILILLCATGAVFFVRHSFSREQVKQSLEETFHGTVAFERFHITYFPHPGCVAEGVTLRHPSTPPGLPPLASAGKLTVEAHYLYLLLRPGFISRIVLEGFQMHIPARGSTAGEASRQDESSTRVGEVIANNSLLEIARERGREPLRFQIHSLTIHSLSRKDPMTYDVAFLNALPPGEIESRGRFGPWNSGNPAQTPVSGTYKFERANLGVFHGVEGLLTSHDNFHGTLGQIETHGTVEVPDFKLTRASHSVPLQSRFHAFVDALNGDVHLEKVDTSLLHTMVTGSGSVAGRPNQKGKTTSVDLSVNDGRIQDVFRIFVSEPRPPFNGVTSFRAHVDVPPEGRPFLLEVMLEGDFGIGGGHFTKQERQKEIAKLSERGQGKKANNGNEDDPARVISDLAGHVILKNGVARFTSLSFSVPGAFAELHGTFNVINEKIDFHGTLKTDASFSQTAGGIKSVFLKPFDAFFKKKSKGAAIPIKITGTYSDPHPGLDLGSKKEPD